MQAGADRRWGTPPTTFDQLLACRLIEYQPMETIAEISGYYARGGEVNRLEVGRGRLEFLRTGMPCGE